MIKTKTLQIPVYFTPDGRHTCGTDFSNGKYCMFYRVTHYGTQGVCCLTNDPIFYYPERDYQEPCKTCILK